MSQNKKIAVVLLIGVFLLSGCSISFKRKVPVQNKNVNENKANTSQNVTIEQKLANQSKIIKFENYDELKDFLENNQTANNNNWGYGGLMRKGMAFDEVAELDSAANLTKQALPTAGVVEESEAENKKENNYSKTNIQVEGVDEADIIKTDGNFIYAVAKNSLFIVKATPAEKGEVLSKIEFKDRPTDIYLNKNFLVIYGYDQKLYESDIYRSFKRRSSYVFVKIFDISDPKNPKQVRDLDLEGNFVDSRMIGDYLYLVTNNYNFYYLPSEPVVPRIIEEGKTLPSVCEADTKCFAPDVYYFDLPYDNYNYSTVTAINIKDVNAKINGEVYLMSGSQNMYVSEKNLYITYTKYLSEYELAMEVTKDLIFTKLTAKEQERIKKIEAVEDTILSKSEKMAKIAAIIERYQTGLSEQEQKSLETEIKNKLKEKYSDLSKELEKTVVHKIAINNGQLEYRATGEVTGSVLNQFTMDESGNYFRIATTKNTTWSQFSDQPNQESYSNLYVLDENLKNVGALEKLAEGERIYSVRFMQNRVYLVTFKQTDPLFVIDLSKPNNPQVLGKLKIPGFSNYLHPYDETTLIGIGKETMENESGGVIATGLKISLFDVADVANPKESAKHEMGGRGSDSIALNDHKAFLFSREKNLLVLPVSLTEESGLSSWGKLVFSGAAVFNLSKDKIDLKGKVDHSDGGKVAESDYWGGYNYYDNTVKRSLYINDTLYTFSNNYLKMNNLADLQEVNKLPLEKKEASGSDFKVIN